VEAAALLACLPGGRGRSVQSREACSFVRGSAGLRFSPHCSGPRQPVDDVANYLEPWSKILENGGYSPEEARAAALQVLRDILQYDRTKPAAYPNGRVLTDDVFSMRFAWLTHGKVPPTGLKPHDDLQAEFPYLGVPNP
jgi:hypothetical protein